jgi:tetratricopeptide (TPR) repeat protein
MDLIGKHHRALIDELGGDWLPLGPPVCVVAGFAGVGKTHVLRPAIEKAARARNLMVASVTVSGASESEWHDQLDRLCGELASVGVDLKIPNPARATTTSQLLRTVEGVLRQGVLIVLDEFNRALDVQGRPPQLLHEWLSNINRRSTVPGRLLVLTNREVQPDDWTEGTRSRVLPSLDTDDGVALLEQLLQSRDRMDAVDAHRRPDVVRWAGGNPRALTLVAGALRDQTLDDLIGVHPQAWEFRDRVVSDALLRDLEAKLVLRVTTHLSADAHRLLRAASVYRKGVKKDGLKRLAPDGANLVDLIGMLTDRFLIGLRRGVYEINPVVQEVCRAAGSSDANALKAAHDGAASYYMQRIDQRGAEDARLAGSDFVEAQFHLVRAGRDRDLARLVGRFQVHLSVRYHSDTPLPDGPEELDERITVLLALLQNVHADASDFHGAIALLSARMQAGGAKLLQLHLARCLAARGRADDRERSLELVANLVEPGAPATVWALLVELAEKSGGTEAQQLEYAMEGISQASEEGRFYDLCVVAATLLLRLSRPEEALRLLLDNLAKVSDKSGLRRVYEASVEVFLNHGRPREALSLLAEGLPRIAGVDSSRLIAAWVRLIRQQERGEDAVALIRAGIAVLPREQAGSSLYLEGVELLRQQGRNDDALALVDEGIARVPAARGLSNVYRAGIELLASVGRDDDALKLLRQGIDSVSPDHDLHSLYQLGAELLARRERGDEVLSLLQEGFARVPRTNSLFSLYQVGIKLLAKLDRSDDALMLLHAGLRRITPDKGLESVYHAGIDLLAKLDRKEEALTLLRDGFARVPAKGLLTLYLSGVDLLASMNRGEEALLMLKEGMTSVSPISLFYLYEAGIELLANLGRNDEARALLGESLATVSPENGLFTLYGAGINLLAELGRTEDALTLIREGIERVPPHHNLFAIFVAGGKFLASLDRDHEALELVREGIAKVPPDHNLFSLYLAAAEILVRLDRREEAFSLLRQGVTRVTVYGNLALLYRAGATILQSLKRHDELDAWLHEGIARFPADKVLGAFLAQVDPSSATRIR